MISPDLERRIKDAANVVDVISDFYDLRKSGRDYECLCPFHQDRRLGSFKISPTRNTWHCFSCGESGDSIDFLMKHEHLTYHQALLWLARKYGYSVDEEIPYHPKPAQPHPIEAKELPMLTLPFRYVESRLDTKEDAFCRWLRELPWDAEQRKRVEPVLKNYKVGHARQGHTIFWQIDEEGKVRTGKMMLYHRGTGKRDRETEGNFSWIHNRLHYSHLIDLNKFEYKTTLFGMHLLNFCPDATVCIVESEKTAIICAIAYGDMAHKIWMASGGLQFLTPERLQPIIKGKRKVILFPDHDGVALWREQTQRIHYEGMSINTDIMEKTWKPEDGEKADLADILLRVIRTKPRKESELLKEMREKNPHIGELIDTLELEEIETA